MSVVEFRPKDKQQDFGTLQFKSECYQKVWRDWGQHLDPHEQIVVLQIIDRTVGWGRREAYFSARAMLKGDAIYSGMKMGKTKFYDALKSLEGHGIVRRRKDKHVPDRVHFTVNMDWNPDLADLPKRPKKGSDTVRQTDYPVRDADNPIRHANSIASNHQLVTEASNQAAPSAPLPSNPSEIIREKATGAAAANRAALKSKASKPQAAIDAVDAAWRLALIDTFPGAARAAWTVREKAQIKHALRTWNGDCALPEFVTWAVTNWTAIMRKQFHWMTKTPPPATPTLSFFISFLSGFAEARANNVLEDWLSADDRTPIERMMGRGQTYEQAIAELAKDKAAVALRDEMKKREVKVRARERSAEFKEQRAQKIAEFEGRAPIHPRSPAALKLIEGERRAKATPSSSARTRISARGGYELQDAEVFFVDPDRNPFDVDD